MFKNPLFQNPLMLSEFDETPLDYQDIPDVDPLDFSSQFNSKLSPEEERQFEDWAIKNNKVKDIYDYDIRGRGKI